MKRTAGAKTVSLILSLCLALVAAVPALAGDYAGLKGLDSFKAVFDVRNGSLNTTAMYLNLIHQTYKDKDVLEVSRNPSFTVVFIGPPVKFVSKSTEGFSSDERRTLAEIATLVSAMSKDGIKFEICMIAARAFDVDAKSILPEITQINSGYVTLIGHQANGYSLVPMY